MLCEKQIVLSVEDGMGMNEVAERCGVILFVAENECYTDLAEFLHKDLSPLVGEVLHVSIRSGFRSPDFGHAGRRAWLTQLERGGTDTLSCRLAFNDGQVGR